MTRSRAGHEIARLVNMIFDRRHNTEEESKGDQWWSGMKDWYRRTCYADTYLLNAHVARAAVETPAGATMLDAGAGEQQYRWLFGHTNYVSCDFGKGDDAWNYKGLHLLCDLEAVPLAGDSVDVCLLTEVLEHISRPELVMTEIGRVLKPGGRVYLTVPFAYPEHQVPHDYHRYTSFALRRLAATAGLEVIEVTKRTGLTGFLAFYLDVAMEDRLPLSIVGLCRAVAIPVKVALYYADREGGICVGFNCVFEKAVSS